MIYAEVVNNRLYCVVRRYLISVRKVTRHVPNVHFIFDMSLDVHYLISLCWVCKPFKMVFDVQQKWVFKSVIKLVRACCVVYFRLRCVQ